MALTDAKLNVREAVEYMRLNGVRMNEGLLRVLISTGRIPSEKFFSCRLLARTDVASYVRRRRSEAR